MEAIKVKKLTPLMQGARLKTLFPLSDFTVLAHGLGIKWKGCLQPNPISQLYQISVTYLQGKAPITKVHTPLIIPDGKKLPHVYSQIKQELCLYYPKNNEWHSGLWIVETIVPWASEWLYHYENWVATGDWKGGGIEHEQPSKVEVESKKRFSVLLPKLLKR